MLFFQQFEAAWTNLPSSLCWITRCHFFLSSVWFQLNEEMSKVITKVLDNYPGNNSTTEQAWDYIQRNVSKTHWSGVRFRLISCPTYKLLYVTSANINMKHTHTSHWSWCNLLHTGLNKRMILSFMQENKLKSLAAKYVHSWYKWKCLTSCGGNNPQRKEEEKLKT